MRCGDRHWQRWLEKTLGQVHGAGIDVCQWQQGKTATFRSSTFLPCLHGLLRTFAWPLDTFLGLIQPVMLLPLPGRRKPACPPGWISPRPQNLGISFFPDVCRYSRHSRREHPPKLVKSLQFPTETMALWVGKPLPVSPPWWYLARWGNWLHGGGQAGTSEFLESPFPPSPGAVLTKPQAHYPAPNTPFQN